MSFFCYHTEISFFLQKINERVNNPKKVYIFSVKKVSKAVFKKKNCSKNSRFDSFLFFKNYALNAKNIINIINHISALKYNHPNNKIKLCRARFFSRKFYYDIS